MKDEFHEFREFHAREFFLNNRSTGRRKEIKEQGVTKGGEGNYKLVSIAGKQLVRKFLCLLNPLTAPYSLCGLTNTTTSLHYLYYRKQWPHVTHCTCQF